MKVPLLCAIGLALALAGCLGANPPGSSSKDGNGTTSPSPTTSIPPPSDTAPRPGGGLATKAQNDTATLSLIGSPASASFGRGGELDATFTATNDGANASTYGGCTGPWTFDLRDANGTRYALEAPHVHCLAITSVYFPHGASLTTNLTWNGTVYASDGTATRAPSGAYALRATFTAQRPDGADAISVTLHVTLAA